MYFYKPLFFQNLTDSQAVNGDVYIGHCPYTVGDDQYFGDFVGNIDEVLICPFPFNDEDIAAHGSGDREYFYSMGYLPAP